MKQTINNVYQFREAFREVRPDNFSYEGLATLWEYFDEYEESTGEEVELDVIAICCDFSEDFAEEVATYYTIEQGEHDSIEEAVKVWLEDEGALLGFGDNGSIVYRSI